MSPVLTARNDMHTLDFIVETRFKHSEMGDNQSALMMMIMDRVAKDVAEEIMKRHKKNLVRMVLRNPELLRTIAMKAMQSTISIFLPAKKDHD